MSLPQLIENVPVFLFYRIVLMTLVLFVSVPAIFFITCFYRLKTDKIIKRLTYDQTHDLTFVNSILTDIPNIKNLYLKLFSLVQLLFLTYIILFPCPPEIGFNLFGFYSLLSLFLFFGYILSEQNTDVQYFLMKKIRILFEYVFLVFLAVILLHETSNVSDKGLIFNGLIMFIRPILILILFLSLWIIRNTLSVDLYKLNKYWTSNLSSDTKTLFKITEQISGFFLLIFFVKMSGGNNILSFLTFTKNDYAVSTGMFVLLIVFLDLFQRHIMLRYSQPSEKYLIKLNNFIFLPFLIISILIVVSL
jgi:hypothetical protein